MQICIAALVLTELFQERYQLRCEKKHVGSTYAFVTTKHLQQQYVIFVFTKTSYYANIISLQICDRSVGGQFYGQPSRIPSPALGRRQIQFPLTECQYCCDSSFCNNKACVKGNTPPSHFETTSKCSCKGIFI